MTAQQRDDDFEGFAPTRRVDPGARPEWLTATGGREGRSFTTPDLDPGLESGVDAAAGGARPRQASPDAPPPGTEGDSWESAVHRAEKVDHVLDDGSGGVTFGSSGRASGAAGIPGLQSILGALSKSPPLVFVAVAVILIVALVMNRPRAEMTVSIAAIHSHPERFDGRPVKVRGRVGEVYQVGGGYAFHLYQGRDDIVVFTRSRVPVRREELTIEGSISNGILDGKPRQALFEKPR